MPRIDPFRINPNDGLDRFSGYWWATALRAGYIGLPEISGVAAVAGAQFTFKYDPNRLTAPIGYIHFFPNDKAVLTVNGTQQIVQYCTQQLGAAFFVPYWSLGRVNATMKRYAEILWEDMEADLKFWAENGVISFGGHSLGGCVAALLANQATFFFNYGGIWTMGQPRVGDREWADFQTFFYERLTNSGDPVPMLPPSPNTLVDRTLFPDWVQVPNAPVHGGTRFHLAIDGSVYVPPERASWIDGTIYIVEIISEQQGWVFGHSTEEYARRLRMGIPVKWRTADPNYPGIVTLDNYNFAFNGNRDWVLDVPTVGNVQQPPTSPVFAVEGRCS